MVERHDGPVIADDAHTAVLYRGTVEFLASVLPFIHDGVLAGEPVTVAVPAANLRLVRDECASAGFADRVRWVDVGLITNPGRIVSAVLHPLLGRRARIVTEAVWPGRAGVEYPSCVRHEALVNDMLTGTAVRMLCPYDATGLNPVQLSDALVTHRSVLERGVRRPSAGYAPTTIIGVYTARGPEPADPVTMSVGAQDLAAARQFVSAHATAFGLADDQLGDVALVVTELITNSIEHGAGQARLRVWTDGSRLLCEVFDKGWFSDPLAGLRPAPADQPHGRGLLLVNSLADLVTLHVDEHGTAIRAHFGRGRGE